MQPSEVVAKAYLAIQSRNSIKRLKIHRFTLNNLFSVLEVTVEFLECNIIRDKRTLYD